MKLKQNQLLQVGADRYRIVVLDRLSVDYKKLDPNDPESGTHHQATKKEFCRLIKAGVEIPG
jgi:hypothetical protein